MFKKTSRHGALANTYNEKTGRRMRTEYVFFSRRTELLYFL
jgi:hypothetical protein